MLKMIYIYRRKREKRKSKAIRYENAEDIKESSINIINTLGLDYINPELVGFIRSYHSSAHRVIARCHGLGKVMQVAFNTPSRYVIEVISERFDKLSEEDKIKTLIHEIMHIPKNFGGGFRHHDYVNSKNVNALYNTYLRKLQKYKT